MRWAYTIAASVVAILSLRCNDFECDPVAMAERLSGEDAVACGTAAPDVDSPEDLADRRTCFIDFVAADVAAFATVSPPSADGGTEVAWAFDGTTLFRIEHHYVVGQAFGCNSESASYQTCEAIVIDEDDCESMYDDLCLRCKEPSEPMAMCH